MTLSHDDLPDGLTEGGGDAFRDVEEEFRERMCGELRRRRRERPDGRLTSDMVYEARAVVVRTMGQAQPRAAALRALGPGLIAVGSVGVGVLSPDLHGAWQIALMAMFGGAGLAGGGLTWFGGRPAGPGPGESAG